MPEQALHPCAYRILRYTPNLVRDEWVNVGVLIYDPAGQRARARLIEDAGEFARVRRLHPGADERVLRALQTDFETQLGEHRDDLAAFLAKLDETLSNVLQLAPQKGVLTEDLDAELERLYRDHVAPPAFRAAVGPASARARLRAQLSEVFRRAGIWEPLAKRVSVEEFTYPGDPFKLDYAYRSNGTRGFVHTLALSGDPAPQAKVLAFTADAIRARVAKMEFAAVTEIEPRRDDPRHQFVARLLEAQGIGVVPLGGLEGFANRLRSTIQ